MFHPALGGWYPNALDGPYTVKRVEKALGVEDDIVAPPARGRRVQHQVRPAPNKAIECGTCKTAKARFWPWLEG